MALNSSLYVPPPVCVLFILMFSTYLCIVRNFMPLTCWLNFWQMVRLKDSCCCLWQMLQMWSGGRSYSSLIVLLSSLISYFDMGMLHILFSQGLYVFYPAIIFLNYYSVLVFFFFEWRFKFSTYKKGQCLDYGAMLSVGLKTSKKW